MSEAISASYAHQLTRMFLSALRDLNGGHPIPRDWRDDLMRALRAPDRRGPKSDPEKARREQEWARRMYVRRMETEDGITEFAEQLADEASTRVHTFTAQEVFTAERNWELQVISGEAQKRIQV